MVMMNGGFGESMVVIMYGEIKRVMLDAAFVNKDVPSDGSEAYNDLPRVSTIPPPSFRLKTSNKAASKAFMRFWNGHFRCTYDDEGMYGPEGKLQLLCQLYDHDDSVAEEFRDATVTLMLYQEVQLFEEQTILGHGCKYPNAQFGACFKEDHKIALAHCLLHHIIRSKASIPPKYKHMAAEKLCSEYWTGNTLKQSYALALDAAILRADVLLEHPECRPGRSPGFAQLSILHGMTSPNDVALALIKVGELLEAMGSFQRAGAIYLRNAEHHIREEENNTELKWRVYEFAALAYKRDGRLKVAESIYVKAFYYSRLDRAPRGVWDLNDPAMTCLLTNMLVLYNALEEKKGSSKMRSDKAAKVLPVLATLLYTAGFEARRGGLSHQLVFQFGPSLMQMLKTTCQSRQGAMQALADALQTPNVEDFRKTLVNCLASDVTLASSWPEVKPKRENTRKADAEGAQKDMRQNLPTMKVLHSCANCGTPNSTDKTLLHCPCRAVYYCNRECQVGNWKEHKRVCTDFAKKQKAKKEAKG